MQVHTTTTGTGPVYIRVVGGNLVEFNGMQIMTGAIGKWFNLKVSIDHATYGAVVYINNCPKLTMTNKRGNETFYFKNGVYTCTLPGECRDHYKNIHLYQK
jgi:hypothetical protein